MAEKYHAIVSPDWNGCLAPCGPFDVLAYTWPGLSDRLEDIFRAYTGNRITLSAAIEQIRNLVPGGVARARMDAYLDAEFRTYPGVAELIEWCAANDILFMINTTGAIGYFQRVFAKNLLPPVPVLSAHPMISYASGPGDPEAIFTLRETADKPVHTRAVAGTYGVPWGRIILMGDSGGDAPHFEWGAEAGALRIGSMPKASLGACADDLGFSLDMVFGVSYLSGGTRDVEREMTVDFRDLRDIISRHLGI